MELQAAGREDQQKDLEGFANIYLVRMFLMVVKVTNYDIGLQMMRGRPDMYILSDKKNGILVNNDIESGTVKF